MFAWADSTLDSIIEQSDTLEVLLLTVAKFHEKGVCIFFLAAESGKMLPMYGNRYSRRVLLLRGGKKW